MSKRAINGKTITRGAHEAALQPENRYFSATAHLQRQNMPKMREIQKKMGLTAYFSRFSNIFPIYETYWPENSQEFQQWGPTYDPQLVGYAHRLARYTPIWYSSWVAVHP